MSNSYKTPGVYIVEKNAFPNSVVTVDTDVPVFIGYTEKAKISGKSIKSVPFKISSLADYELYFGKGFHHVFSIEGHTKTKRHSVQSISNFKADSLQLNTPRFYLYDCLRWFYMNGGSTCYILSIGEYGADQSLVIDFEDIKRQKVFEQLEKEKEPALIVLPDFAIPGEREKCYALYNDVLKHCLKTKSRMGIFDVIPMEGESLQDTVDAFRNAVGDEGRSFGAVYYPWLQTSVKNETEIDFTNLDINVEDLPVLLPEPGVPQILADWKKPLDSDTDLEKANKVRQLNKALLQWSLTYKNIMTAIYQVLNLLPPSSAMAGIYSRVDRERGVWKAPANVSVIGEVHPTVAITDDDQEGMNVDNANGKSINAIREFVGRGIVVWGARTLDGNSQGWRYINVRRTMIMIEQSVKAAMEAYVFEPNDSNTWVTVKSLIDNFFVNLWKQGALMGSKPEDAFFVHIGLGQTMTTEDIVNGKMRLTVGVAMVRPAEFIVLNLEQQQATGSRQ